MWYPLMHARQGVLFWKNLMGDATTIKLSVENIERAIADGDAVIIEHALAEPVQSPQYKD